jgi:predicted dehydrogenase
MTDRQQGLRVALVGLQFGLEFAPIYQAHPDVAEFAICDTDRERVDLIAEKFGIERTFYSLEDVLADDDIDAVHLVTPVTMHGEQSIAVLEAGKHCACTIPMALTEDELRRIVDLQKNTGLHYMMMETAVYTREFLYVKELVDAGKFGRLAFARGAHLQDMEGWPDYWQGFPPLQHITHALSPVLAATGARATKVHCFGSGTLPADKQKVYGNPFPVETAVFRLDRDDLAAEVTRSMFETARPYTEAFSLYGDAMGFEWQQLEEEQPYLFEMEALNGERGRPITSTRVDAPDRADLLPEEIRPFTRNFVNEEHLSFIQGGGHGGSHPHLVHEFVSSIREGRAPRIDASTAANWTMAGLAAHESAMHDGAEILIPEF